MQIRSLSLALCLAPFLATHPALSNDDCGRWSAEIWEAEGGEVMTASVCNDQSELLYVQCGAGEFALRLESAKLESLPDSGLNYAGQFLFTANDEELEAEMSFEAMDGDLVTIFAPGTPVDNMLKQAPSITISSKTGDIEQLTFPLEGAAEAISTVANTCSN